MPPPLAAAAIADFARRCRDAPDNQPSRRLIFAISPPFHDAAATATLPLRRCRMFCALLRCRRFHVAMLFYATRDGCCHAWPPLTRSRAAQR
jgi:hypothetical protein